jgi:hypothetical protein
VNQRNVYKGKYFMVVGLSPINAPTLEYFIICRRSGRILVSSWFYEFSAMEECKRLENKAGEEVKANGTKYERV